MKKKDRTLFVFFLVIAFIVAFGNVGDVFFGRLECVSGFPLNDLDALLFECGACGIADFVADEDVDVHLAHQVRMLLGGYPLLGHILGSNDLTADRCIVVEVLTLNE